MFQEGVDDIQHLIRTGILLKYFLPLFSTINFID